MFSRIRKNFLTGLVVLLPLVLTALVFQYAFLITDDLVVGPLYKALPFDVDRTTVMVLIKVLIAVLVVCFICLIGLGTQIFILRSLFRRVERLLTRVPMVNRIYTTIRDMINVFARQNRELFRSVVLIQYPRVGVYSIAFVTRTSHRELERVTGKELVSVFLPTTPNPTSGLLMFIPKDEVQPLPFTVEEAIKLIISGGALSSTKKGLSRSGGA